MNDGFDTRLGTVASFDGWNKSEAQMYLEDAIIKYKRQHPDSPITLEGLKEVDMGVPPQNVIDTFFGGLEPIVQEITSKLKEPTTSSRAAYQDGDVMKTLFPDVQGPPQNIGAGEAVDEEPVKYDPSVEQADTGVMRVTDKDIIDDSALDTAPLLDDADVVPLEDIPDGADEDNVVEEIIEYNPEEEDYLEGSLNEQETPIQIPKPPAPKQDALPVQETLSKETAQSHSQSNAQSNAQSHDTYKPKELPMLQVYKPGKKGSGDLERSISDALREETEQDETEPVSEPLSSTDFEDTKTDTEAAGADDHDTVYMDPEQDSGLHSPRESPYRHADSEEAPDLSEEDISMVPKAGPKVELDKSLSGGTAVVSNGNGKKAPKTGTVLVDKEQIGNKEAPNLNYVPAGMPVSDKRKQDEARVFDAVLDQVPDIQEDSAVVPADGHETAGKDGMEGSPEGPFFSGGYTGGADYDEGPRTGKKIGVFATIAALAVAGYFGLNALFGNNEAGKAQHKQEKQESQILKQEENIPDRPKFDAVAWEDKCSGAALEHLEQKVQDDHPKSLNHSYNLSPDGKDIISNQGLINAAYWYGTRELGRPSQHWSGGYGNSEQHEMAKEWLATRGVDMEQLKKDRGGEFDTTVIDATMVNPSVVAQCAVPYDEDASADDASADDAADTNPENIEQKGDDGKGATNTYDHSIKEQLAGAETGRSLHRTEQAPGSDSYRTETGPEVPGAAIREQDHAAAAVLAAGAGLTDDDRDSIAEMYAQAVFDTGSGFKAEDIQRFYQGVTPEIAREIYLDEKMKPSEQSGDELEIAVTEPMTEAEYLISQAKQEIDQRFDAIRRSYTKRLDMIRDKLDAVKKDVHALSENTSQTYQEGGRKAA